MLAIVIPVFGLDLLDGLNEAAYATLVSGDLIVQPLRLRKHRPTEFVVHGIEPICQLSHGGRISGNTDSAASLRVRFCVACMANHLY